MESLANYIETYSEGLRNIQKKIDPSKSKTPLYRDVFETMIDSKYQQDSQLEEEGLVVVASFVSRPSNLGGIARTCEIFGVKTLVIANASHIKDKEFQSLSVSAERWINMLQVFLFLKVISYTNNILVLNYLKFIDKATRVTRILAKKEKYRMVSNWC